MLIGQNGILNRGIEAKIKTSRTQIIELARLDILEKQAENTGNITSSDLRTILTKYFSDVPETLPESAEELEKLELTSIESNHKIKVGEIWKGTTSEESKLPQAEGTKPYLPSSDFTQVVGTDLNTGLVIEDKIGNQYVWIEVPTTLYNNTNYNTETTAEDRKPSSSTDYDNIEYCLHQYTMVYRKWPETTERECKDVYMEDSTNGWYTSKEEYNNDKQKMLKSVYENGGFWIGRYEAGIEKSRTESGVATIVPKSKENLYPYTYVTRTQAQVLAKQVNSGKYTSSLMYGVQWDLVLKYLETKAVEKGIELETIQAEINVDNKSWGNFTDATFKLNRGKYAQFSMEPYGLSKTWNEYTYNLSGYVENQNKLDTDYNNNGRNSFDDRCSGCNL